jgi:predicted Zn-dependent peptidase
MQKVVMPNGLKVLYSKKSGSAAVVSVTVKVGSNDEPKELRGISHFLEHMLFEGTKDRPNNKLITNEIERIGGDFNAYTTNERTSFYIKVLNKHSNLAFEILSDIIKNSLFKEEHIAKEKNIVIKEIDMVHDEPGFFQWILFQENLFKKHLCRNPVYGEKGAIEKLTREKIIEFYSKYYVASNMIVTIVGDLPKWREKVKKYFDFPNGEVKRKKIVQESLDKKNSVKKVKRHASNTYFVLGFKTVPRSHKDSYIFDVINGILGRGQSGRIFIELRSNLGLAYDTGSQHVSDISYGFFAVYATISKKNVQKVKDVVLREISKLKDIDNESLQESKDYIEGSYLLDLESTQKLADQISFWEHVNENGTGDFLKRIKAVTVKDIKRVAKKYFNNYTMTILEGN